MNEESNKSSKKKDGRKGYLLDFAKKQTENNGGHNQKTLELLITDEQVEVWNLLSRGKTQAQVAKELGISISTVNVRINQALEQIRGWAGRQAEDWANKQLLIIAQQVSEIIDDTQARPIPRIDSETGEQEYSKAGYPLWDVSPADAAKTRNMARITLQKFLKHEADLLGLTIQKMEIKEDKRLAIAIYNDSPDFISMEAI